MHFNTLSLLRCDLGNLTNLLNFPLHSECSKPGFRTVDPFSIDFMLGANCYRLATEGYQKVFLSAGQIATALRVGSSGPLFALRVGNGIYFGSQHVLSLNKNAQSLFYPNFITLLCVWCGCLQVWLAGRLLLMGGGGSCQNWCSAVWMPDDISTTVHVSRARLIANLVSGTPLEPLARTARS